MSETMNLEKAVLDNLRILPNEKQQEVLDFVEFLVQKATQVKQDSEASDSRISSITQDKKQFCLREIARLPIDDRHKILAPYIASKAEEIDEKESLRAAASNPVFAFLDDPEEDIYTLEDGKPLEHEG